MDDIWIRVQQGDSKAFEVLYKRLYPGLCYYASQLLGNAWLAEETVLDLFFQLWESKSTVFSQNGSIRHYLYKMLHNRCLDVLKQQQTQKHNFIQYLSNDAWSAVSEKYGFDEQLIEKLDSKELLAKIDKAIDLLPEQCREIFRLSRIEGMSNDEIARQMNISVSTVKTQIYRATTKLRKEILLIIFIFLQNL